MPLRKVERSVPEYTALDLVMGENIRLGIVVFDSIFAQA